jgi:hypothetical protein
VRPLARDISLMDVTRSYQKFNINTLDEERESLKKIVNKVKATGLDGLESDGYSSREIEASTDESSLEHRNHKY